MCSGLRRVAGSCWLRRPGARRRGSVLWGCRVVGWESESASVSGLLCWVRLWWSRRGRA